jgi:hypothetical protein
MPYLYACLNNISQNDRQVIVYVGFVGDPDRQWSWIATEPPIYDANAVDPGNATPAKDEADAFAQADAWIKGQGFNSPGWGCPFHPE